MKARSAVLTLVLGLAACRHAPPAASTLPPVQAQDVESATALIQTRRPERFKMVHQVAASYQGQSGVMEGYLLGRRDGAFRVSATATFGPRLFDAVKRDGEIQTRVHLKQISERLDVRHIARAIDRIYFLACPSLGQLQGDVFVARCPLQSGDDVDELEQVTSARYLEPVTKRYFLKGATRSTIKFEDFQSFGERWLAKRVTLAGSDGYSIEIALADYVPNFAFDDALLELK